MIRDKVKGTIGKYKLLCKNDKIVIGLSGGPDSVALLYLLNGLKKEFKLHLYAAHLDHGIRKSSKRDAEFSACLANKLKIPFFTSRINIKELGGKGSLEEICRKARLIFLSQIAKETGADKIALGHNLDDQAETVLMRILRGSGLYGLSAILPKRTINGFEIIRPLINIQRKEIEKYLKKIKVNPQIDKTNSKDIYLRNKIRNKLMPVLEKEYNLNVKVALSNLAQSSALDYDYLAAQANRIMKKIGKKIDLKKFSLLHLAMQRMILRRHIAEIKGDTRKVDFQHIREIEELISSRPSGAIVDLPKGVSAVKKGNFLSFYRR
ncbi:MAG: tRNA lysidine(34) synthetase TilS [Candidatus Omnitrophica bacterium]|jgi:tRNA(Ile)-lysidine synthase|nr:tRNA lysidine(34) synthetase TilS [Candidatus Omnitrophota bacterium]